MRVLHLIGNGFDINLGLKTKYHDFYDYYIRVESNNAKIAQLKEHLQQDIKGQYDYWSDLEIAMGKYTQNFSTFEEMEIVYNDLNNNLRSYIQSIEQKNEIIGIDKNKLIVDLAHPERYLTKRYENEIINFINRVGTNHRSTSIISFNYTKTIEKILDMKDKAINIKSSMLENDNMLDPIIHIHGTSSEPLIGLNNKDQIKNEWLRNDENAQYFLLKPKINETLGYLRDENSLNLIKNAHLICLFGLSLGKTDKLWWEAVGERLRSHNCKLIYFAHIPNEPIYPTTLHKHIESKKNFLLSETALSNDEHQSVRDQIYVAINSNIFGIK